MVDTPRRPLVASGTVFRIEPVQPINSTSPGEGREPDRPLPENMTALPIVGVVDGGMTAGSYRHAEAWRAPRLVADGAADRYDGSNRSCGECRSDLHAGRCISAIPRRYRGRAILLAYR